MMDVTPPTGDQETPLEASLRVAERIVTQKVTSLKPFISLLYFLKGHLSILHFECYILFVPVLTTKAKSFFWYKLL